MSERQQIPVELDDRSYEITIQSDWLDQAGTAIQRRLKVSHAVVISDENVERPHAIRVAESLVEADCRVDLMIVPPGETSKSLSVAEQLWDQMLESQADRTSVIVAVGGGVVGDLAGFIAATYARGVPYVQVPTSLLAQVDSSVGGKVAINLPLAKNMVGAFWQPSLVLIDTETLSTLPRREFLAGLGEVVKYGVIQDASFFAFLEQHAEKLLNRDDQALSHVIARCCELKAQVVKEDEREETGRRAVLNYGHTFAHALEAADGYDGLLHGEAVAIGMVCAARLACSLGRADQELVDRQLGLLTALELPVDLPSHEPSRLLDLMRQDKKVEHGQLRFVLPSSVGHVELVSDVDEDQILDALSQ